VWRVRNRASTTRAPGDLDLRHDVYLDDGDGDPADDHLVARGRNRTLMVVAAPSSGVLIGPSP
jgi:hypothetical protein